MTLLRTSGLTRRFGGLTAVDDVDFELDEELCSLIGPNGAGKTTFFNLLTGTLAPTEGTIEFNRAVDGGGTTDAPGSGGSDRAATDGGALTPSSGPDRSTGGAPAGREWVDVTDASPHETAALGIHRSFQITNVFPHRSVLENVRVAAQAHGSDSFRIWRNAGAFEAYVEEAHRILDRVGLGDRVEMLAANLSHGEKRTLEVAVALAGDPDVLLLDEPNAGVSSESVDEIVDLIDDVASDHAVLLVEHNMEIVMNVSDRIVVLHRGAVIADGPPEAVRADPAVQDAYLGGYKPGNASAGSANDAASGSASNAGSGSEGAGGETG